jgi:hypothetical protein
LRHRRPDIVQVDRAGALAVAESELEQCRVPRQMAVQMPRAVVARQPSLEERGAAGRIALLEEAVDTLVRGMGIAGIAGERALDQPRAPRNLAGFDIGPAEISEKPPVVFPICASSWSSSSCTS